MADLPKEQVEPSPPFTYSASTCSGHDAWKKVARNSSGMACSSLVWPPKLSTWKSAISWKQICSWTHCEDLSVGMVPYVNSEPTKDRILSAPDVNYVRPSMKWIKMIKSDLLKRNSDWIEFNFNAPKASHMGRMWERWIRTIRSVLIALLEKNGSQLNDEALQTLMCEAEAICFTSSLDAKSPPPLKWI